jgi:hypothetical protein
MLVAIVFSSHFIHHLTYNECFILSYVPSGVNAGPSQVACSHGRTLKIHHFESISNYVKRYK